MSTSAREPLTRPALAKRVRVSDQRLSVELSDGREISAPLAEFPELMAASPAQRAKWEITDFGTAIYWRDIDEEIGLAGLLGVPETLLEEAAGHTIHNPAPSEK